MATHRDLDGSDYTRSSNETQRVLISEKYLRITKKRSLKWERSFESLQSFFDSFINKSFLNNPMRGGCKQYEPDNSLEIRRYSSSKSLCFSGPARENIKLQLINLVPKEKIVNGTVGE